jgi:L-alanine-DL-glutamate epimerase-like enolase superfamily enzyme
MELSTTAAQAATVVGAAVCFPLHVTRVLVRRGPATTPDRIEIQTSGGISGYGEGFWGEKALNGAPELVIGRSPFEVEAIFEDLSAAGTTPGGLDMALWDAAARVARRPTSELLGKIYRRQVRVASSLCVDGAWFLEEPLPAADLDGYRRLKEACTQPIAAGRTMPLDVLLRDFIQTELIDLALPNIASVGLTGMRRLAYFCWVFRVRLAVACAGSPLITAAALHAAACFVPVTRAIAAPAPFLLIPHGGADFLPVPNGHGLGIDPDWCRLPPDFVLGD